MSKQLENRLSSREVAEMMEMEHPKLLRKIDGINEDFVKAKIGFYKYWNESEYINPVNNKPCREFQISKKGCEFLAHKTTGTKGNLFTDKYMDRFSEMEQYIKEEIQQPKKLSALEQLKLQYQVLEEHEERFVKIENQLESLEVNPSQRKRLQNARHKKVFSILGGKKSVAYKNASFRSKVYSDLGRAYNNYFDVTAYDCTPKNRFDEALEFIDSYNLSTELAMELKKINNQVSFEEAM